MRSTFVWAIGMGLLAGLIAGCEGKNARTVETAPPAAPPPVTETPMYPAETLAPAPAPAAEPVTAAPPSDVYMPPPPEETIPIPPEEEPVARSSPPRRSTARPAPRNNYASAPRKASQTYTVRKGDTLQKISQKFYGTTRQWRRIYEANRRTLKGNPEKIYPGMKLTIPPR